MRHINFIKKAALVAILLALIAVIPSSTFAGTIGFFSRIEGKVDILRGGSKTPTLVRKGEAVSIGDIVRTKINSRAQIIFKDETSIRLAPETRIKIDEYLYNPDRSRNKGTISLLRGKMSAVVSGTSGGVIPVTSGNSTFNIQTPTAVAGVRGVTLFVFYQYGVTGVIFKNGSGFVSNLNNCGPSRAENISDGEISFVMRQCAAPLPAREVTGAELAIHNADTTFKADTDGTETKKYEGGIISESDDAGGIFGYGAPPDDIVESVSKLAQKGVDTDYTILLPVSETNPLTLRNVISAGTEDNIPPVITVDGQSGDTPPVITVDIPGDNVAPVTSVDVPVDSTHTVTTVNVPGDNATQVTTVDGKTGHTPPVSAIGLPGGSAPPGIIISGPGDNIPPVITINGPSGVTNLPKAVFLITSNEPVTINYKIDTLAGAMSGTPGTLTLDAITEGNHLLTIIAADAAGNKTTKSYAWFYGTRHYTMTGLASGTGSRLGGAALIDLYVMSAGNQGGWLEGLSGTYTGPSADSWQMVSGGKSYTISNQLNGYWLDHAAGVYSGSRMSGTSNLSYMSTEVLGSGSGIFTGSIDSTTGTWQAEDAGIGTCTETPLAFSASFSAHHYYIDTGEYRLAHSNADLFSGITGTTVSPFLNPGKSVALNLMGEAHPDYSSNHTLWWAGISGNDYVDTSAKWAGWLIGSTSPDNIISGEMNGLYVDSAGSAGILRSNHFTGAYYPGALNVWEAEGSLTAIGMAGGYPAGSVAYITAYPDSYLHDNLHGTFGIGTSRDIYSGSYLQGQNEEGYDISQTRRFAGEPWGIYQLAFGGEFNSKPAGTASFTMETDGGSRWFSSTLPYADTWCNYTAGTWNENNTIEGKTYGYAADTSTPAPTTWISVGDTIGTYNPDLSGTYGTWQAGQMGVFLETTRFLSMTHTAEGQAKLAQLNIPYAGVGRATLTGSGNNFRDITMADTVFFAYNSGEAPKIWATGDVSGSYISDPALHNPVILTGGGLAADFILGAWDTVNGQWRSEIRGSGGFNGSTSFQGAGAGTINTGAGTISGTAAGIVK